MTPTRDAVPDPPQAPDSVQVMATGEQPFLTRAARRAAREQEGPDLELPPIAHVTRYVSLAATVLAAFLIAASALAGDIMLAGAIALGSLIIAWGWPKAAGLPSPKGATLVLVIAGALLVAAVLAAESDPHLRWASGALALGLVAMFLQQLLRRDGRPRLAESVMGTSLGLVVLASAAVLLPFVHIERGPQLVACAMAAVAVGTLADLFVRYDVVRAWLLPLAMVLGGFSSVLASLLLEAPDVPPAALIGVCAAGLSHAFRRMLSPEAGSYSSQGQIATGLGSIALVGPLLWAINHLLIR